MTIVSGYYTQSEQSLRQALWFSGTGWFTIIGSALNYGFAQIVSSPSAFFDILPPHLPPIFSAYLGSHELIALNGHLMPLATPTPPSSQKT